MDNSKILSRLKRILKSIEDNQDTLWLNDLSGTKPCVLLDELNWKSNWKEELESLIKEIEKTTNK